MNVHEVQLTGSSAKSPKRSERLSLFWCVGLALLACLATLSLTLGRLGIPVSSVVGILLDNLVALEPSWSEAEERVVELIRVPRILLATIAGAGLAVAGASLQGIFRNPLVSSDIIGVSAGAAFGGALAILLFDNSLITVGMAFAFGLVAIAIVSLAARSGGRTPVLMIVLAGVVTGAFFMALVSLITYIADPEDQLPAIVYWLLGSFASADYQKVLTVAVPTILGAGVIYLMRYRINILSLGDEDAAALGLNVEQARWIVLVAVALITASTVAVAGVIGWVGLVVPHVARMIVGPDHRVLIPASALIGAGYLLLIDDLARSVSAVEIPLGVLTALIGAPLFVWLLRRTQAAGWGGA